MNNDIQNIAEAYDPTMGRAAVKQHSPNVGTSRPDTKWHVSILIGSEDGPIMITIKAKYVDQIGPQKVSADGVVIDFDTNIGEVWKE